MIDGLELLSIRNNRWIKALIDVSLSDRNIIFKINNAVLVNIVIHFVVHTLHHMVSDKVVGIRQNLKHCLLDIVLEIPSYYRDDTFGIVVSQDLDYIVIVGLNQLSNFSIRCELKVDISQSCCQ